MSLQGKVALVTGATRGIGRAIALSLGEQGATVIGTATSEKGAATISEYLQAAGIQGKGLVLNVTEENAIDETVTAIEAEFAALERDESVEKELEALKAKRAKSSAKSSSKKSED